MKTFLSVMKHQNWEQKSRNKINKKLHFIIGHGFMKAILR